jgi:hypothetical protein
VLHRNYCTVDISRYIRAVKPTVFLKSDIGQSVFLKSDIGQSDNSIY